MNQQKNKEINLPNFLLIIRFFLTFLVLIFIFLANYSIEQNFWIFNINNLIVSYFSVLALLFFLIAAFTDFLDGYIARKKNLITDFGKFFDPIADKILVNSVLILFSVFLYIPAFIVILFIIRDLLLSGLRMQLASKNKVLAADKFGKYKTFFQFLGISILFIFHPQNIDNIIFDYNSLEHLYLIPLYISLFFSLFSLFTYYKNNFKYIFS